MQPSPPPALADEFDYVVGLGSNLGEPQAQLERAAVRLADLGVLVGLSAIYESAPLGPPQPHYLNAAGRLRTPLGPRALLEALLGIEREAGRERRVRWGPRTLDLDILWMSGRSWDEPGLSIPHPELPRRAFALLPLLDVAPDATDPAGEQYAKLLESVDCSEARRVAVFRQPITTNTRGFSVSS